MTNANITRIWRLGTGALLLLTLFGAPAGAQDLGRFTFNFGGGVTSITGSLSDRLSTGWHINIGGGFNFTPMFGLNLEYQYNGLGVKSSVLKELQVPNGSARLWSITLNPIIRFGSEESRVRPYITGGGGYYRRTVEFTEPTTTFINIFDPWWGWIGPVEVPANRILGSVSRGAGGFNAGAGLSVRLGDTNAKFYSEARFHYADMAGAITRIVPVTVGIRW
jgi:opacity protein-like surface antigen